MTDGTVRRGRPRAFDEEAVIDAAIGAFRAKGFTATTLLDLETATGLDRSSLYNSFGGKSGLYERATSRYLVHAREWLFEPLVDGSDDGLGDIGAFLDRFQEILEAPEAAVGCLIVNDLAAGCAPSAAAEYRDLLGSGIRRALDRAGVAEVEARTRLVESAVVGINLLGKHNPDRDEIVAAVDALRGQVTAWRI